MAYVHCHSCGWSQDDFYPRRYNPATKIWDSIKWLWKPRTIEFEEWIIRDMAKYTHVLVVHKKGKVFTWNWLIVEIIKDIKLAVKQHWWSWKSFKKDTNKACPLCDSKNLDID